MLLQPVPARGDTPGRTAQAMDSIKIGVISSLSGPVAELGQDLVDGISLYFHQMGDKVSGHSIELVVENDDNSADEGLYKVRKLVERDKVNIIDGFYWSHVALAALPFIDQHQVPTVVANAYADDLTQRKRSKWVIRTSGSASQQTFPLGDWACKTAHYKRAVTIGVDNPFAWQGIGGFQESFERAGGQVVQKMWFPIGFVDFSGLLAKIRKDADVVVLDAVGLPAQRIPQEYKRVGLTMPLIAAGPTFEESNLQHLGDEVLGAVSTRFYSNRIDTKVNKAFVNAYEAKFGKPPSGVAECGYVSAMCIYKAVAKLNGNIENKEKLMSALQTVKLEAPRGEIVFDKYNNPVENVYLCKVARERELVNQVDYTFRGVSQYWNQNPEEVLKKSVYTKDYPPCTHCAERSP
jgi:branched-chain amino acid transport system substrate-binding protein